VSARALVIGLDGADVDVIASLGPASLPTLTELMARGAWARLRSVLPPATLPNWTTFLTGVDPGVHGVFDFTIRRGTRVEFAGGTVREAPTIAARLDRLGLACAVLGFPATWPPERLAHGIFVSGWDSPVAFEADRSFVWPPERYDAIRARFGPIRFGEIDEIGADCQGWHEGLAAALEARIAERCALARWVIEERAWDLVMVYFGESDTAAHHLWAHHDPGSPRHPTRAPRAAREGLARVYEALDRSVGALVAAAGDGCEITIVSDHGSGGASDKVLYLNRALAEAGLLAFRPGSDGADAIATLKDLGMRALPPRARDALFRAAGRALPGWIESRARFGTIDFARTRVFSDELNYFPALHVNLRGREPEGIVRRAELGAIRAEIEALAARLRDPWSGAPVIAKVHAREELFSGPHVDRAPDFLLELALDRGYSWNLLPSASAPPATGPFRRLAPEEYLGRKGRSLPGSHRPRGLLIAAGPRVRAVGEIDARIADATATLLARLDVRPGTDLAGRVLREILARGTAGAAAQTLPEVRAVRASVSADLTRTEARLRALGYVD
jgi:predicted AlkP superfamily phosphohydrolase/phosphomutase